MRVRESKEILRESERERESKTYQIQNLIKIPLVGQRKLELTTKIISLDK